MSSRLHVGAVVALAIVVFLTSVWATGGTVSLGWISLLGGTITFVTLCLTLFNTWLWKLKWLQGWFVRRPHIWGIWNVTIDSDWVDPTTNKTMLRSATFTIRQTYSSLQLRMTNSASVGDLLTSTLIENEDGGFRLAAIYRNEPYLLNRPASQIAYGALLLDVIGDAKRPDKLQGHYWTDRDTKGTIIATRQSN